MGEQVAARTKKKCSAVEGRKGRDVKSRRTLKTAYTIILQSMNFRLKKRKFVHTKNRKPQK